MICWKMCWAEHTEAERQGVWWLSDKSVDSFLFVGWLDGMVVTVLTDSAKSLPGETK